MGSVFQPWFELNSYPQLYSSLHILRVINETLELSCIISGKEMPSHTILRTNVTRNRCVNCEDQSGLDQVELNYISGWSYLVSWSETKHSNSSWAHLVHSCAWFIGLTHLMSLLIWLASTACGVGGANNLTHKSLHIIMRVASFVQFLLRPWNFRRRLFQLTHLCNITRGHGTSTGKERAFSPDRVNQAGIMGVFTG